MSEEKCTCWKDREDAIREQYNLQISSACSFLRAGPSGVSAHYALPLEQVGGKKPNRSQPKHIAITHCPFCGKAL